jgi:hypothetical protein
LPLSHSMDGRISKTFLPLVSRRSGYSLSTDRTCSSRARHFCPVTYVSHATEKWLMIAHGNRLFSQRPSPPPGRSGSGRRGRTCCSPPWRRGSAPSSPSACDTPAGNCKGKTIKSCCRTRRGLLLVARH